MNLSRYICLGWPKQVQNILDRDYSLDLMAYDGQFFNIAVEQKNCDVVKVLLDYFERRQLTKFPAGSNEFLWLKKQMSDVIQVAIEDVELSKDMEELLNLYLPKEETTDYDIEDLMDDYAECETYSQPHTSYEEHDINNNGYSKLTAENIAILGKYLQGTDAFSNVVGGRWLRLIK